MSYQMPKRPVHIDSYECLTEGKCGHYEPDPEVRTVELEVRDKRRLTTCTTPCVVVH